VSRRLEVAPGRRLEVAPSRLLELALPFWLDRPDEEALEIAGEAGRARLDAIWIGELATFDAIALATAVGARAPGIRLKLGPLAIGVRSPVALALGACSVAALTGNEVELALGASSPAIVSGWHDREWAHSAPRMHETIECLRAILSGDPGGYEGRYVRSCGFRLRRPRPETRITVAAFGPAMTRVGARHADEVVCKESVNCSTLRPPPPGACRRGSRCGSRWRSIPARLRSRSWPRSWRST
jgi:probable F420-dependent oxidoreductase